MSKVPDTVLISLGYAVVHPDNEFHQLELHGVRFKQTFKNADEAWAFAEQDLTRRTHRVDPGFQIAGPDYRAEAMKLGFEVTGVRGTPPKYAWRNRDLDVASLRLDYPTETEAWRSAYMWARRFAILWKE